MSSVLRAVSSVVVKCVLLVRGNRDDVKCKYKLVRVLLRWPRGFGVINILFGWVGERDMRFVGARAV